MRPTRRDEVNNKSSLRPEIRRKMHFTQFYYFNKFNFFPNFFSLMRPTWRDEVNKKSSLRLETRRKMHFIQFSYFEIFKVFQNFSLFFDDEAHQLRRGQQKINFETRNSAQNAVHGISKLQNFHSFFIFLFEFCRFLACEKNSKIIFVSPQPRCKPSNTQMPPPFRGQ